MQILENTELDFSDVLIKPRRSTILSRKDVDVTREYKFKYCPYTITGTGIMNANMGTIGIPEVCDKLLDMGLFACLHKFHEPDALAEYYAKLADEDHNKFRRCFLAIGMRKWENEILKIDTIIDRTSLTPSVRFDVPNGYIPRVKECVIELRKKYPDMLIGVGNVVTGDICEDLILSGADILYGGIGGGSACLSRRIAGVGRPQLSTIIECADACHQCGGQFCSDGGITCPGDIVKAFGAGADMVMIGGMFAGTNEADGEIITKKYQTNEMLDDNELFVIEEKKFKVFYGSSSTLAQEKFMGGKPSYRASEGRVTLVPYVGGVSSVVEEMLGGLRSGMTYIGAKRLKDIPKQCVFYKVHNQLNRTYENTTIGK